MISLDEIKNFDIKSIDLNKLQEFWKTKKELVIQFVLVIATFVIFLIEIGAYFANYQIMKGELAKAQAKAVVVQDLEGVQLETKNFLKKVPGFLDEYQLAPHVVDLAEGSHVSVLRVIPGELKNDKTHESMSVRFEVSANSMKDVAFFVKAIESSPSSLRIDSLTIGRKDDSGQKILDERLDLTLVISSVRIVK